MTLEDLGKIKTILRIDISIDNVENAEKAIREWVSQKKYQIDITHEDKIDSILEKLGFAYEIEEDFDEEGESTGAGFLDWDEFNCQKLCFSYSEFLSVILPYLYGGLIIVKAELTHDQPMSIVATQISTLASGSDDWSDCVEVEIREATEEDFEEGYPW